MKTTRKDDSGEEGRDEGGITGTICSHRIRSLWRSDCDIKSKELQDYLSTLYILSYIVTGHPCDRVTEFSIRFYMT